MIYLDTDVWVNYYTRQDAAKRLESTGIVQQARADENLTVSTLVVQELLPVLRRLEVGTAGIRNAFAELMDVRPFIPCNAGHLRRGFELAGLLGLQHFNDCIHTAVAEAHCDELITYNRSEFGRLRNHTGLRITIL